MSDDHEETITENPESLAAWKREAATLRSEKRQLQKERDAYRHVVDNIFVFLVMMNTGDSSQIDFLLHNGPRIEDNPERWRDWMIGMAHTADNTRKVWQKEVEEAKAETETAKEDSAELRTLRLALVHAERAGAE